MDIRTKFVFALVSVALGSMLSLGVAMYRGVERELRERTLDQLDGLAQFKVDAMEGILAGWHDRVDLVGSRTQLRRSLDDYGRTRSAAAAGQIDRILSDALEASRLFRELWVHDLQGAPVAGAGAPEAPAGDHGMGAHGAEAGSRYVGTAFSAEGDVTVSFVAGLELDGVTVGYLHAVMATDEVASLSSNYQGLGRTGETMVVALDDDGQPRVLHPLRFADGSAIDVEFGEEEPEHASATVGRGQGLALPTDGSARLALSGSASVSTSGLLDYRGEEVWVATRFLPETGWGVVVKVDADEQIQPIMDFRDDTVRLAVTLAAFAIVIGTFLGFRFAKPILALVGAAQRLGEGDLTARANVEREDEVGLLSRAFDRMAGELEEQVGLLTEYRKFFDVSIDLMCIASTDGYFKRVNPAFSEALGWSEEELLGQPFISLVHPDDVDPTFAEIEKLAEGIPTIRFDNRFRCADGSYRHLQWNSYPEEGTGRLYAIARVKDGDTTEAF